MSAALMDRPTVTNEWNHQCIVGQCSVPCPYTSLAETPEIDVAVSPEMLSAR